MIRNARWTLAAAAAIGGVGELARRRRSARSAPAPAPPAPPPPVTTQSSPGQIADLQQTYGGDTGLGSEAPRSDTSAPG